MNHKTHTGWNDKVVASLTKEQLVAQMHHLPKDEVEAKWDEVNGGKVKKVKVVEPEQE